MSDEITPPQLPQPPALAETPAGSVSQWGSDAPRGGKTVLNRFLKDEATVPLFFGQTLIKSLRDVGYNSTTSALCEHVDNAIQWGATEVRVYFCQKGTQPKQKIDVLILDNGKGMAPKTLKVAMAFGGSMVYENRSGIGRYGMGMKTAALNIAPSVDVYSWQELGAFYSMTLDVDAIGKDRSDMIKLDDPQMSDALPSANSPGSASSIVDILTRPMSFPSNAAQSPHMLTNSPDELTERLGESGTIVYMPNCDRLTYKTDKTLVDHAMKEFGRVYRRFLADGLKIYVNNRPVEVFDPTFWMPESRHTKVEGLTATRSKLVDSWVVMVPLVEGGEPKTEVRVRVYMLPVESWALLPPPVQKYKLQVFEDHTVSFVRNGREVAIGSSREFKVGKHHTDKWLRVEVEFMGDADEGFGVAANKQGVRLKQYVVDLLQERLDKNFTQVRKVIRAAHSDATTAKLAGKPTDAERQATEVDSVQSVALPAPPTDTPEQIAALDANLRGLAVNLRHDGETEDQAFERVKVSKFLTEFVLREDAPFYDTDYKFGKLILRMNTEHLFYQKVWHPLSDLAKKANGQPGGEDGGVGMDVSEASRRALTGLQLLFLSLARAQTQMVSGENAAEYTQLFKNLRKSWSGVLETQLLNV